MDKLAYTYEEAAEIVGVSDRTIRRMVDAGDLPVIQFRRSKRIPRESLEDYINDNKVLHEKPSCPTNAKTRRSGGSVIPMRSDDELERLLGLKTDEKRRH